ncbi:MAG TPA: cytochrome P460 family protein [Edaphobacter sp.]|nr:cytochrome P460 family protein [Edaphobacter sp.]
MNNFAKLIVAGVAVFVALQTIRPTISSRPATAEIQAPPEVKRILEAHCYSCHSDQRRLSWFDEIVPGYWLVRHDVLIARSHLNFSTLGAKPAASQRAALFEAVNMIQLGAMPLPSFLKLHPEARVSPEEIAALKAYLAPWTPAPRPVAETSSGSAARTDAASDSVAKAAHTPVSLANVRPEGNGFQFDPSFKDWKPISTTDRGDNNTFRFILGNDVAVNAIRAGRISPWPDGARLAKIAWQQKPGPDGLVYPGKFVQIELMLKNASLYKDSEGWGWGRWRGMDLKPYGKDAAFVGECTSCHRPLRGNDYVYTLPISAAKIGGAEVVNNRAAMLPASLPYQPLDWNAITMYVDPKTHTMATLYGNDVALQIVKRSGDLANTVTAPDYPPKSVLALVTWRQRDDPHWFGARIPDLPQSVEFVQVESSGRRNSYRSFGGPALQEDRKEDEAARMHFILTLTPVELP